MCLVSVWILRDQGQILTGGFERQGVIGTRANLVRLAEKSQRFHDCKLDLEYFLLLTLGQLVNLLHENLCKLIDLLGVVLERVL